MPFRSLRAKLIVFWIAFASVLVAATNLIAFRTALDAQFLQLRQTLMAIAATGALSVDGDLHQQVVPARASREVPAYQTLVGQLRAIRNANPAIRYVYTMVPSETPGQWYFIGDADEQAPSLPGDAYDVSRFPAMMAGLQTPSTDPALTMDEWGPLLSGYAPLHNRAGETVAVLGIDMSGAQVVRIQAALRRWRLSMLLLGLVAVCLLGLCVAVWISRPLRKLVAATERIGRGDFDYRVPVRSQDEVGRLARAFNRMGELLAESRIRLREHVVSTIQSLTAALEAKDVYTRGHSARVQYYAVKLARQMGLPPPQVDIISQFSLLHDIGKIGVKEEVLNKPAKLSGEEFEHIKRHPDVGYKILAPLHLPDEALEIVKYHHERLNGQGYPYGLTAERIPLHVAIVSAADAFDAMTGRRPYREMPMTFPEAVAEMRRCSGTQFRPDVVEALVEILKQEGKLPT